MTDSANRPAEQRRTGKQSSVAEAVQHCGGGSYTDRHDRPRQAPRSEGAYVSGATDRPHPGSYTDVDGLERGTDRTDGYYTRRG
ncbi:hypothetical protein J2M54_12725 [Arthrobacter sp. zg-ZUI227]|uniref:hypothetical protein n=1 Tax=Arthrobacter jiangjiafuii TaxID=2817475 RepID=UPI001AEE19FF|nr:hypothetical protein [Arthrobacter jiangjiafuii]MBP3044408.1 hypothetical protein [Arthrobacter jiangjiafuii]